VRKTLGVLLTKGENMDKVTCPSCGAVIAQDGSAVYSKGKVQENEELLKRIESLTAKIEKLEKEREEENDEEDEGPFSEFQRKED
jgi:DNA-directed RNA polymerase subunit M/transcription elongation factor TFIIS